MFDFFKKFGLSKKKSTNNTLPQKPAPLKTTTAPPQIDTQLVKFVVQYCRKNLHNHNIKKIVLYGSRAVGNHRPNSDHDFMVVLEDAVDSPMNTGTRKHTEFLDRLRSEARRVNVNPKIDLLITYESHYLSAGEDTHAYKAREKGKIVFSI